MAASSPPLATSLPAEGLLPAWVRRRRFWLAAMAAGAAQSWPADASIYSVHARRSNRTSNWGRRSFPGCRKTTAGHLTPEQYVEYEKHRREEDQERGKAFDYREIIYCFDARTGKEIWKNDHPSIYTRFLQSGTPVVDQGRLFILAAGLKARAIDAETGRDLWETRLPGEFLDEFMMSSFAVVDEVAVVLAGHLRRAGRRHRKTAVGRRSAEDARRAFQSHGLAGGRQVLAAGQCGRRDTVCLEPKTGREMSRVKSEANLSTPVVVGNRLITLGNNGAAACAASNCPPRGPNLFGSISGLPTRGAARW